jgi:hypothetical protein
MRLKKSLHWNKNLNFRVSAGIIKQLQATPEISMLDTEQKSWLEKIFTLLREGCKDVLMMWASSFSMQEIAAQLKFSNAQVAMNKKSKCLKQLHQLLADRPDLQQLLRGLRESS